MELICVLRFSEDEKNEVFFKRVGQGHWFCYCLRQVQKSQGTSNIIPAVVTKQKLLHISDLGFKSQSQTILMNINFSPGVLGETFNLIWRKMEVAGKSNTHLMFCWSAVLQDPGKIILNFGTRSPFFNFHYDLSSSIPDPLLEKHSKKPQPNNVELISDSFPYLYWSSMIS